MIAWIWLALGVLWTAAVLWLRWRAKHEEGQAGRNVPISHLDLLAGGSLLLLTLGFFWRTISGDVYQPADGGDLVSFLFPTYRFAAATLREGSLPLWNPHLYGGAPFISDIQAGFLYPPNLLLFLLQPEFSYRTMQALVQGHIYWAGLGVYVLIRTLPWGENAPSRPAALIGALAFQFSDPLLTHLGNLNLIAVLSWVGWILAAYSVALERRSPGWAGVAALLFATANYAGHAQSSLYLGLAVGVYTLIWLTLAWQSTHKLSTLLRSLLLAALTLVIAALLTAPILLPALGLTQFTERADFTYQDTVAFSLAPTQAIGLITPNFFGRGPALHWSLWDRVETPYAGIVTLILAGLGVVLASRAQRRRLLPWLGLALFGFVTALGVYAILHGWLTLFVPGFDELRAPARALVLWTLGLAVLAAWGAERATQWTVSAWQWAAGHALLRGGALVLGGIAVPLCYLSLLLTQESETAFLRASVAALAITVAAFFWLATWGVLAAYRARWMGRNTLVVLLIGLLFFELSANGGAYSDISPSDPTVGYRHPELVEFLRNDPELFRIDTRTDIALFWQPDAAALHGLQDVWGVANPLLLSHWAQLWDATGGRGTRVYDLFNAKYVIVADGVPLPDGFELAFDAPDALSVYRNVDVLPRAWVVHRAVAVDSAEAAFAQLREEGFDPAQTVILQTDGRDELQPGAEAAPGSATVNDYRSSSMRVQVQAAAPGYLVLSEVWFPGWRATVNGAAAEVLRANGALRAIPVPAGESEVRLWFAPAGWRQGLVAFAVGGLLLLALWLLPRRRHSKA